MLTKSHQAARRYVRPQDRQVYRQHMCGLCHALGDHYGLAARLLTNHDMILLNLLTSAQRPTETPVITRRCPLNPLLQVATNQDDASTLAAAVAVELAAVSVADDVQDSQGRDLSARFAQRLLQGAADKALETLEHLGLDTLAIRQLGARQTAAEGDPQQDPAAPSAEVSAGLFVLTARLAGNLSNTAALSSIGAYYGAYLYLADAYRDYAQDLIRGEYNPLRPYVLQQGDTWVLSRGGLLWLRQRLRLILAGLREQLGHLHLYRAQNTVAHLLTDPLSALIARVETALHREHPLAVRRWRWLEVLKAALFVLPEPLAEAGLAGMYRSTGFSADDEEDPLIGEKPKRKRKQHPTETTTTSADSSLCGFGFGSWECAYCASETCANGICESLGDNSCDGCGDASCDCSN